MREKGKGEKKGRWKEGARGSGSIHQDKGNHTHVTTTKKTEGDPNMSYKEKRDEEKR